MKQKKTWKSVNNSFFLFSVFHFSFSFFFFFIISFSLFHFSFGSFSFFFSNRFFIEYVFIFIFFIFFLFPLSFFSRPSIRQRQFSFEIKVFWASVDKKLVVAQLRVSPCSTSEEVVRCFDCRPCLV